MKAIGINIICFSTVEKGDICELFTSGGGGFGNPYLRPADKVLEDVINEMVSIESAKAQYGVVINKDTLSVDQAATDRLRANTKEA